MLNRMGLFSSRARRSASSPQGYQSTGLWACCSRYGLVSSLSRLAMALAFQCRSGLLDFTIAALVQPSGHVLGRQPLIRRYTAGEDRGWPPNRVWEKWFVSGPGLGKHPCDWARETGDDVLAIKRIGHAPQRRWLCVTSTPDIDVLTLRPHDPDKARPAVEVEAYLGGHIVGILRR